MLIIIDSLEVDDEESVRATAALTCTNTTFTGTSCFDTQSPHPSPKAALEIATSHRPLDSESTKKLLV